MKNDFWNWVRMSRRAGSLAILLVGLDACSVLKASPAADSGFLPDAEHITEMRNRVAFNGLWFSDRQKFYDTKAQYHKLFILPIDTTFLESRLKRSGTSPEFTAERLEDIHEIARYMRERFKESMTKYPDSPIRLVDEAGPGVLVLELSIVELGRTNVLINTVGTAAGIFVPGGDLIKLAGSGSIAFEGILRDGDTAEILVEFKDRATDKPAPFTLKDFQVFGHAREAIDDWADQYAELSATPYEHQVSAPLPFTLWPF